MRERDELDIKAEIDAISKKIDAIMQTVERLDPSRKDVADDEHDYVYSASNAPKRMAG